MAGSGSGVRTGDFAADDPLAACVVILVTIDGLDSYADAEDDAPSIHPVLDGLTVRVAERELGLPQGGLRPER
ncbi:hypothetical protein [Streptomyces sp. NPDC053431]|uniref:hypothetical protein n=1 Tax=Streptomyces sp. NPDC053431 TaxID=3365703 RepID=UPI0037D2B464